MHEYPLILQIIRTAERYAGERGAKRVGAVHLVVGDLSGCAADSVALYFDIAAAGTLCAGAELRLERVRPMLRCQRCGELFERKPFLFACDREGCGGEGSPTEIGREFYIRSIEVEE